MPEEVSQGLVGAVPKRAAYLKRSYMVSWGTYPSVPAWLGTGVITQVMLVWGTFPSELARLGS